VARLPVQRRLLVAGDARHRDRAAELSGLAVDLRARAGLGQALGRHAQQLAQLVAPAQLADVEQQRP
jgi:hypothetical protein